MKYLLIIALFISFPLYGQQLKTIKKGESAPYDGFVIDKPMEKSMRKNKQDLSLLQVKTTKLEALSSLQEQRMGLYREGLRDAEKGLRKAQSRATWGAVFGFTLGVGLSAIAVFAITKAAK